MTINRAQLALLRAQARRCVRELDRLCDQLLQIADGIADLDTETARGPRDHAPDWSSSPRSGFLPGPTEDQL